MGKFKFKLLWKKFYTDNEGAGIESERKRAANLQRRTRQYVDLSMSNSSVADFCSMPVLVQCYNLYSSSAEYYSRSRSRGICNLLKLGVL